MPHTRELKLFDIIQYHNRDEITAIPIDSAIYDSIDLNEKIKDAIVIDASEFMDSIIGRGNEIVVPDGIIVPPFTINGDGDGDVMWIEGTFVLDANEFNRENNLYKTAISNGYSEEVAEFMVQEINNIGELILRQAATVVATKEDAGWAVNMSFVYQIAQSGDELNEMLAPVPITGFFRIDNLGYLIKNSVKMMYAKELDMLREPEQDSMIDAAMNCLNLVLSSFSVINKSLEFDIVEPSRTTRRRITRMLGQKRGILPLTKHAIVHMYEEGEKRRSKKGDPTRKGSKKRVHKVRWHFRRVSDKGLFGKGYKAGELILIPEHRKGDKALGELRNQYKLHKGRKNSGSNN